MSLVILLAAIVVVVYAPQLWVRGVMKWYSGEITGMPGTGGELAQHLAERFQLGKVKVERNDEKGDHYDPKDLTVRLSPSNFDGKSLTAVAIATHEISHAIQHHEGHALILLRERLYPVVYTIERIAVIVLAAIPVVGVLSRSPAAMFVMFAAAAVFFLARVFFHVITLPLEWDASFNKALPIISDGQYVAPGEEKAVRRVLLAAALTYVAGALADILSFWRWILIFRGRWI